MFLFLLLRLLFKEKNIQKEREYAEEEDDGSSD